MRMKWRIALAVAAAIVATSADAADRIRLAVQRTGTLAWELDVIRAHGLDKKANLDIVTTELASTEAGKIAIKGGSADMMLMVLAFVGVFGIGCLVFAIGSGFMRHWRLAGEMERLDAQAHHWEQNVPGPTPIDRGSEQWGLPGPEGPSDPDREGGPAISGR